MYDDRPEFGHVPREHMEQMLKAWGYEHDGCEIVAVEDLQPKEAGDGRAHEAEAEDGRGGDAEARAGLQAAAQEAARRPRRRPAAGWEGVTDGVEEGRDAGASTTITA